MALTVSEAAGHSRESAVLLLSWVSLWTPSSQLPFRSDMGVWDWGMSDKIHPHVLCTVWLPGMEMTLSNFLITWEEGTWGPYPTVLRAYSWLYV